MALTLRHGLWFNDTWLILPPLDARPRVTPRMSTYADVIEIPNAAYEGQHYSVQGAEIVGYDIEFSGRWLFTTAALGLTFEDVLWTFLFDDDGKARVGLTYALWSDTDETIKRYYRDCVCLAAPVKDSDLPGSDRCREYSFTLLCGNPEKYATAPDDTFAPAGDYEYATPGGEGAPVVPGTPGSGLPSILLAYSFSFPDEVEVTDGDNVGSFQETITLPGLVSETAYLQKLQITRAQTPATGTTTVRASKGDWDDAQSYIAASVTSTQTNSAIVAGSIEVAGNANLYVFVTAAGGHSNVRGQIVARIQ